MPPLDYTTTPPHPPRTVFICLILLLVWLLGLLSFAGYLLAFLYLLLRLL